MERILLDDKAVERSINRITHEIIERNHGTKNLGLIGIRTRGVYLANRIRDKVLEIEGIELPLGVLDITMYRDDISKLKTPEIKKTDIRFDLNNATIILVDDVIYTGRTTRAAMDAIMDIGRPKKIQMAVLVDRGLRELPIRPDYIGIFHSIAAEEEVLVKLREIDGKDEVVLLRTA
ncbi:MAG TPA: bifunctional pyr operon transcriptional regulator/uracil phosphoribosyltransferase PyrR [Deltaproteobacteria bacterium]|nr:bifunctional pyr operon transcriptional regulator/uracil phosphoribosyltransferase PyrR [Deltaproteobacteria bacterium]